MHLPKEQYTVGWICARSDELVAAQGMLDEQHGQLQEPRDSNIYYLGTLGSHNIAICCLPEGTFGTTAAAKAATNLTCTFPRIEFALLVGVGSGVPSTKNDIRLGDVVVSTPGKGFGGVVPVDVGEQLGHSFLITGVVNQPPGLLLTAVSSLDSDQSMRGNDILKYVNQLVARNPVLGQNGFGYDMGRRDDLFDGRGVVRRPFRPVKGPVVHHGRIASGNTVVRDRVARDHLGQQLGVICLDNEAAGLMNILPCLAIRGIADYADSRGDDSWRRFAAAAAAGYAKELLSIVPKVVR
ncbi:Pfs domain protein [Aspergillus unguis]